MCCHRHAKHAITIIIGWDKDDVTELFLKKRISGCINGDLVCGGQNSFYYKTAAMLISHIDLDIGSYDLEQFTLTNE